MGHIQDRWYRPKRDEQTGKMVLNAKGKPVLEKTELYGKGLRYKVRYLDPDGEERSKSFPDKQKKRAEDFLIEMESDKREGKYVDPRAGLVPFEKVALRWLDAQTVDYTSRERLATRVNVHLLPHFGKKPVGSIKPSDVQRWLRAMKDGEVSETSRALYFGHLVSIFNFAIEDKVIGANPTLSRNIARPRINRRQVVVWSHERVRAVRDNIPERFKPGVDIPPVSGCARVSCSASHSTTSTVSGRSCGSKGGSASSLVNRCSHLRRAARPGRCRSARSCSPGWTATPRPTRRPRSRCPGCTRTASR
ncbi:hypothetical protein [Prauserella sp. PE36]|uniref:phage integrase central domain-containing protein n=1 Tax=Prauserella sp. PE36 TaxID=1504709 RepID=UPI001F36DD50|nr:hypothetical protein [Prauserella sp. PE36]